MPNSLIKTLQAPVRTHWQLQVDAQFILGTNGFPPKFLSVHNCRGGGGEGGGEEVIVGITPRVIFSFHWYIFSFPFSAYHSLVLRCSVRY